ncbi:MAG: hypothetical protein AB7O59_01040 [Pirellulales bacterium]
MDQDEAREALDRVVAHIVDFLTTDAGVPIARAPRIEVDRDCPMAIIELRRPEAAHGDGPPNDYGKLAIKVVEHPFYDGAAWADMVHLCWEEPIVLEDYIQSVIADEPWSESINPVLQRLLRQVDSFAESDGREDLVSREFDMARLAHEFGRLIDAKIPARIETAPGRNAQPTHVSIVQIGALDRDGIERGVDKSPAGLDARRVCELTDEAGRWLLRSDVWVALSGWAILGSQPTPRDYWAAFLLALATSKPGEPLRAVGIVGPTEIPNFAESSRAACERLADEISRE